MSANTAADDDYVYAGKLSDFPASGILRVTVDDQVRVLARTEDGDVTALDGICSHEHAELADGDLEDDVLWCPFHAAGFDVRSGEAICLPATTALRTYVVRVNDDDILVCRAPSG
jgi:3-phenylpropionate/trans-cinnamate dioxygenase ferredoxin subunit